MQDEEHVVRHRVRPTAIGVRTAVDMDMLRPGGIGPERESNDQSLTGSIRWA